MKIQESAENYLETILILKQRKGEVRSIDIVNELHFSKPSVSIAMKKLRESGLIHMAPDGLITLLPEGMQIASSIYERHVLLSEYLIRLGVRPEVADEDACRIEHVISEESFEKIKVHALNNLGIDLEHLKKEDRARFTVDSSKNNFTAKRK